MLFPRNGVSMGQVLIIPENPSRATVGGLGARTASKMFAGFEGTNLPQAVLLKKTIAHVNMDQFTGGEGPVIFGMAYGELTVAQIEEALEDVWNPTTGSLGSPMDQ